MVMKPCFPSLTSVLLLILQFHACIGQAFSGLQQNFHAASRSRRFPYGFPDCKQGPLADNLVCNSSASVVDRASALVNLFSVDELLNNTESTSDGVSRLGLPPYEWWSEALHGVASSPGVPFERSGNFSYATSFPMPILISAAFDDKLVYDIATVISDEGRAFSNHGEAGLNFWSPDINPFKDPRWGRGQETPGEDPFRVSGYAYNFVTAFQGGVDPKPYMKLAANCKHFLGYDLEEADGHSAHSFNAVISQQDIVEYYLPPFQACVRDAKAASVMCSYNAVNGVPMCANKFYLQTILRDLWGFGQQTEWITGDCGAVREIYTGHRYAESDTSAAAYALQAGVDIDCGSTYRAGLRDALNQSSISYSQLRQTLVRQYSSLIQLGYFDDAKDQSYRQLGWEHVNTQEGQRFAYQAAVKGIVLLKNDGTLPLQIDSLSSQSVAFIGPWANATAQMQGNYWGVAPYLISPIAAAKSAGLKFSFAQGTDISSNSTSGFSAALKTAKAAKVIIFIGGPDNTIEREGLDRVDISWPGNQLQLIQKLSKLGKPLIVVQMGAGQCDHSTLKHDTKVNGIIWAGYPGQSGGTALLDILLGKISPAGRLPITQYPAEYTSQITMSDMYLRPNDTNPGRTYKWYNGTPVFQFGHGLHYTTFELAWVEDMIKLETYNIQTLITTAKAAKEKNIDQTTLVVVSAKITNTGDRTSDYVALLFSRTRDAGPPPYPHKELVAYTRLESLPPRGMDLASLTVKLGSLGRVDSHGNTVIFPGTYEFLLGTDNVITRRIILVGHQETLITWPQS